MSKNLVSIGGSVRQSAIVAGDRNKVELAREAASGASNETGTEEVIRAIGALREHLEKLETEDRGKISRALADAHEEAQKPTPDKEEVAGALERIVKYAKTAKGVGEVVVELQRPLSIIAGWVGTTVPIAARLFGLML
jgi:type I site-specific restriction endonuclease